MVWGSPPEMEMVGRSLFKMANSLDQCKKFVGSFQLEHKRIVHAWSPDLPFQYYLFFSQKVFVNSIFI